MDLTQALAESKPGDRVTIKIIRGNQTISLRSDARPKGKAKMA